MRPGAGGRGNQEAPSPKLPSLFELRCPRQLALVGSRKAVKTRPDGRNNSRRKLKDLLSSYGLSNLGIAIAAYCVAAQLCIGARGGGMGWGSYVRLLLRDRVTARWW